MIAKRTTCLRQVAGQTVVVTAGQTQEAIIVRNALLVHDGIAQGDVIIITGSSANRDHQGALSGSGVHDCNVDVRSKFLLGAIAQTTFLQRIAQIEGSHGPRHSLAEADGRWDRQLGHVLIRYRGTRSASLRLGNVRHRTPDGVIGAGHFGLVCVVDRNVTRQDQEVLETFEDIFERDAFFFGKCVCHDWLLI